MTPNPNQTKVIYCDSHSLVVACPGSGKTETLVQKARRTLITYPSEKILVATFTKAAAASINNRTLSAAGKEHANNILCGTLHSLALRQLKAEGFIYKIIHENEMTHFIKRALEECKIKLKLDVAVSTVTKLRSSPAYVPDNDDNGRLYQSYSGLLEQNKCLDMPGILLLAVRLMRSGRISALPYKFLFVDEAQDLDELQYSWCMEHIKAGAICTLVGDDDQSIYGFNRALGYDGMVRFHNECKAHLINLDTNYRCKKKILASAGNLIKHNKFRLHKTLKAERDEDGIIEIMQCESLVDEAKYVVGNVLEIYSSDPHRMQGELAYSFKKEEFAILARNKYNLNHISMLLTARGIPHTQQETDLWQEEPICFVLGFLSSLVNDEQRGYEFALYFLGIEQDSLTKLSEDADGEYIVNFYRTRDGMSRYEENVISKLLGFSSLVKRWQLGLSKKRTDHVIQEVFNWFVEQLKSKNGWQQDKKINREIRLLSAASKFLVGIDAPLSQRLQRVQNRHHSKDEEKSEIFLGTLHSSKGLEFQHVLLIQNDEHIIPDKKTMSPATLEEERRLMYVGMTRAKDGLYMSFTKTPSSFISEIGIQPKRYKK